MRSVFVCRPTVEELERPGQVKRFLFVWLPAIIGVAVIVAESTPTFSAAKTSRLLRPFLQWLFGPMRDATWEEFHHLLRKTGHFVGYGTLCVLFLRSWLLTLAANARLAMRAWRLRSWGFAVASTFVVASGDEIHQTFLPSRTGMFSDVVLDTIGGIVVSGVVMWVGGWLWRRAREGRGRFKLAYGEDALAAEQRAAAVAVQAAKPSDETARNRPPDSGRSGSK